MNGKEWLLSNTFFRVLILSSIWFAWWFQNVSNMLCENPNEIASLWQFLNCLGTQEASDEVYDHPRMDYEPPSWLRMIWCATLCTQKHDSCMFLLLIVWRCHDSTTAWDQSWRLWSSSMVFSLRVAFAMYPPTWWSLSIVVISNY